MRYRVEGETLDGVTVGIFQNTLQLLGPNDDRLVGTSTRKLLPIAAVCETINDILVTYDGVKVY